MIEALPFVRRVLRGIDERQEALAATVVTGRVPDFPAYREACGRLEGLRLAREIVTAALSEEDRELMSAGF